VKEENEESDSALRSQPPPTQPVRKVKVKQESLEEGDQTDTNKRAGEDSGKKENDGGDDLNLAIFQHPTLYGTCVACVLTIA